MIKKLVLSLLLIVGACGLESYPGGDLPTQTRLNAVQIGDHKEKVLRLLGTPATESIPLKDGTDFLVYAQNLKESRAFLDPKEVKRDVYVYYFNAQGILTRQEHLTLADGQILAYDPELTDVGGRELSVWDQIIQNFGRYNTGAQDSSVRR